jgi:gliding motility-associated-like protein
MNMKRCISVFSVFFLLSHFVLAQNFYNKAGTIVSISQSGTISVKDSLVNQGTLINNGNMVVGGTWLNLGNYNAGGGQITFNSDDLSAPQVINHNNQSFSKLVISGGGVKEIRGDMHITESLALTDGIITTPNQSKIYFEESAVITGGSDNSHITSPVYHTGGGTRIFPIGNGTTYLPVTITDIGADSEIGIILTELSSPQNFSSNSLVDISNKRYWTIDIAQGSLESAKIILPVEGDEGLDINKVDKFVVAYAGTINDNFQSLGRARTSTASNIESKDSPNAGVVTLAIASEGVVVFNAISPNSDDDINNHIRIENLVSTDVVSIYNRWGDMVFEMKNYDNEDVSKRFNGTSNVGGTKDLPTGTYFYVIRRKKGDPVSGYLSLRR